MPCVAKGDKYNIEIACYDIDLTEISTIYFRVGTLEKHYPTDVPYDTTLHAFMFPVTADETGRQQNGKVKVTAKTTYTNGDIIGQNIGEIDIFTLGA